MTYSFNIILCASIIILFFSLSVLLKLLKHVKQLFLRILMNAKENMFLIKKVVIRFNKK